MPRVSDEVIEKVALHEAGHLVVCEALCPGSVGFASLLPSDENRCGGFIHCCKGVSDSQSAIIALGGKAAAAGIQAFGHIAGGIAFDIQQGESQRTLLGCRLADTIDRTGDIVAASLRDLPRIPHLHGRFRTVSTWKT